MLTPIQSAWLPHPQGWLKLNTDAAMDQNSLRSSLGWILRDPNGLVVAAAGIPLNGCKDVLLTEAPAMREGLQLLAANQHINVLIESDSEVLVRAINNHEVMFSEVGIIITDCSFLLSSISNARCSYVRRSVNKAADAIAKVACSFTERSLWNSVEPRHFHRFL